MSTTDAVPAEATSTGEPQAEVNGAIAELETVMTEFSTKTWRDDLTLVVENRQLFVSKSVLSFASPVFDAMFTAEFQEKDKEEITLPGKTLNDFVEFLKCFYPGILKPVTLENVFKILPLANEYQVESLKSPCEVCLLSHLSSNRSAEDVYVVLEQACTYGLEQVKGKCIDIVAERPLEEFDEAANTFSFSDNVHNKIRKKLLQALSIKNKDLRGRVKTSEALNRFLGDMASRRELVTQFLGGHVDGDYVHLKVSSKFNNSAKMCIGGSSFSISLSIFCNVVYVEVACEPQHTINCLIAVLVHNWMLGNSDKNKVSKLTFDKKKAKHTVSCSEFTNIELANEKAGFMYRGTMDFYIYIFCIDE